MAKPKKQSTPVQQTQQTPSAPKQQELEKFLVDGCDYAFVFGGELCDPNEKDDEKKKEQEEENVKKLIETITNKIEKQHLVWALLGIQENNINEKLSKKSNDTRIIFDNNLLEDDQNILYGQKNWECLQVASSKNAVVHKTNTQIDFTKSSITKEIRIDIPALFGYYPYYNQIKKLTVLNDKTSLSGHFHQQTIEIDKIKEDGRKKQKEKYYALKKNLQYKYFCVVLINPEEYLMSRYKKIQNISKSQISNATNINMNIINKLEIYQIAEIQYAIDTFALIWNPKVIRNRYSYEQAFSHHLIMNKLFALIDKNKELEEQLKQKGLQP